jgi:hypothetical protein
MPSKRQKNSTRLPPKTKSRESWQGYVSLTMYRGKRSMFARETKIPNISQADYFNNMESG